MALALGTAGTCWSAAPLDALRVVDIQPSVFDYLLTGLSRHVDGSPRLSFNDRTGNTWFRSPGDMLGTYRLVSFETRTNRAFNTTVKAWQESRVVSAVLSAASGTNLTLVQGERLPWPGWTARLVSLDTGLGWAVREADALSIADTTVRVTAVTATAVSVASPSVPAAADGIPVPALTDPERAALAQRWAENAKRRQEALAAAARSREVVEEAPPFPPIPELAAPRRRTFTVSRPAQMAIGTIYRYPTEFQIIPAQWDTSGRLISEQVVVPRRFESRSTGISITTAP